MSEPILLILQRYAARIRELRRANAEVAETALAPAFQTLIEELMPHLPMAPPLTVVPEFRQVGVGRPDIALIIPGTPPRAFVELKAPSKSADPTRWRQQDKNQFERFCELSSWSTCNFHEFRLLERAEQRGQATVVPEAALNPDRDDRAANRIVAEHNYQGFLNLLERLCVSAGHEPIARDAQQLATLLAHSSRLVRGIIQDRLAELNAEGVVRHPLLQVRQEFRDVLYAHPEVGGYNTLDFDTLFSGAFAQTLAFGLLLVREATGQPVGCDAWRQMPEEHPLMRTALRVLSEDEIVSDTGIGFDVICDTINCLRPEILAIGADGHDPILYFYEDFLETFDPEARERYGVFYTPIKIVRYMTGALDRALRENLHTAGLSDPAVTILDPATGTGTFLLGVAERVRANSSGGAGIAALALQNLAGRMYGFELLVGPYAVAHYRLHHALRHPVSEGAAPLELPRLGIFLADTLGEPGAATAVGPLGYVADGIRDERHEANRIKSEQPVLAIIGNPPYRRLEEGENRTLVGNWMDGIWRDLKEPVSDAGKGNQLNTFPELSVAFWRWAIWKLFESDNAPQRGVIAYITNRKFLTGWPYAGLRKMMRERFDRIEIIDLRGDSRRGERAGVEGDQNVFNIQVGVCITLAIADGSKADGELADVFYRDAWAGDLVSRESKLNWLEAAAQDGRIDESVQVERDALDDFRPKPFQNGEWLGLDTCFMFRKSGMKSGNDPAFVSARRETLHTQMNLILSPRDDPTHHRDYERQYIYRPFDRRWFYNDLALLDRPGPDMQRAWGAENMCLYAMGGGTGAGPAVWCHGQLPDYHSFRGSYGGYAFPLYDRRRGPDVFNISPALLETLTVAHGNPVSAPEVFDAALCLLSATRYSLLFAEDLEDVFPHVPFPADYDVFLDAVRLGREIRAVETFSRVPNPRYLPNTLCNINDQPRGTIRSVDYRDGGFVLCEDGTGQVSGIPQEIWSFSVSGYMLLPRWLNGRVGLQADFELVRELRDICGRIAEVIDLFAQADHILSATLEQTLSRATLGLDEAI